MKHEEEQGWRRKGAEEYVPVHEDFGEASQGSLLLLLRCELKTRGMSKASAWKRVVTGLKKSPA